MHPELLGALARQRHHERTPHQLRPPSLAWREPRPPCPSMLRRARRQLGSMLLDVGVHLMTAT